MPSSRARCSARQTAEAIAKATGAEAEVDERLAPGATVDDLRDAVRGRGATIVVVGHQPDCSQIAAAVTGGPEPPFRRGATPVRLVMLDLAR